MSEKIKIIADDKIPFLKGVLEPYAHIEYYSGNEITSKKVKEADAIIIRTRTKCDARLLDGTKVKFIATATIGIDHIDVKYCKRNNIKWVNAPGCNSSSVMQYVMSALFSLALKEKFNLAEKTIGIIGVVNVGSKVQKAAEIIGMNVLLNDPPRERKEGKKQFCNMEKIIELSNIITFHIPLIKEGIDKTFHLVNKKFITKVKNKPIIINTSRGAVIRTSALKKAIKNNIVSYVVLDVWENEPDIDLELMNLVDFATPHIAGYSTEGKVNGTTVCVNEINKYFNLGLKSNWLPEKIPNAEGGNEIIINCENKSEQKIISEAILGTYSIDKDDIVLRNLPSTFEKQRGEYRVRREFENFNLILNGCNSIVISKLIKLGFKIIK